MSELYDSNPRAVITQSINDSIVNLVAQKDGLTDTFVALHAGFICALVKIGVDVVATIVVDIVRRLDESYKQASQDDLKRKECLNLASMVSSLYSFDVVGCGLIFDLVRMYLKDLTDLDTELLLKTITTAGLRLRQDDSQALREIVAELNEEVKDQELSLRTRFMVEQMVSLRNNKKLSNQASVHEEAVVNLKKHIPKFTDTLRFSLDDVRNSKTRGQWWVVGASYKDKEHDYEEEEEEEEEEEQGKKKKNNNNNNNNQYQLVSKKPKTETKIHEAARRAGMNNPLRQDIFIAIMSASDYEEAAVNTIKLDLKNSQIPEIAFVLVQCVGKEKTYNPYYAAVAGSILSTPGSRYSHKLKKAIEFTVWDVNDDKASNVGAFLADLVLEGYLQLSSLRNVVSLELIDSCLTKIYTTTVDEKSLRTLLETVKDNESLTRNVLLNMKRTKGKNTDKKVVWGRKITKEILKS